MQSYSIREVIEMAIRTEKLGAEFYNGMAVRFGDKEGLKDLLTKLSTMEMKHERVFTGLLDRVSGAEPEGWDEAGNYFRAIVESRFFLGSGKSLPNLDHISTVDTALDFAIGFEKETALFFMGLRDAVADADRSLVDEIIEEEKGHIAMLTKYRELFAS